MVRLLEVTFRCTSNQYEKNYCLLLGFYSSWGHVESICMLQKIVTLVVVRPPSPLLGDMKVRDDQWMAKCRPFLFGQSQNGTRSYNSIASSVNSRFIKQESYCKRRRWSNELKTTSWLSSVFSRRLHSPKAKYSFAWRPDTTGHTVFLANQLMNISSTESTTVAVVCKPIRYIICCYRYGAFTSKFIVNLTKLCDSLLPCDLCLCWT